MINNRTTAIGTQMFNNTKYTRTYYRLINRAHTRQLDDYKERHHIIPQSMGGNNKKENLVYLTAREHFICHWLLIKMTSGSDKAKMLYALNMMRVKNDLQERYSTKITSRVYENYRKELSELISKTNKGRTPWNKGGVEITDEHRKNLRSAALNRPPKRQSSIDKWRESRSGYKDSEETRLKKSLALKGKPKGPMSEEQKLKRSVKQKGTKKKDGHSNNVRNAVIGNISINKEGIEKKVKRDILQQYLDEGWQLGGKKRK